MTKAATLNPWTRALHAHLRELSSAKGLPVGLTVVEAADCEELGPLPFDAGVARRVLRQAAIKGWFSGVREKLETGGKGGSQSAVRYFAAADLPPELAPQRPASYFDGLVRASSVFELAQIVGGAP